MYLIISLFLCAFLLWGIHRLRKNKRGDVYFYLDEDGNGHIEQFPKGTAVDGVKLTDDDLRTLKEKGELDISDRKNFKTTE